MSTAEGAETDAKTLSDENKQILEALDADGELNEATDKPKKGKKPKKEKKPKKPKKEKKPKAPKEKKERIGRRIISAHTVLQQLPYIPKIYKNSRATMFCIFANCLLDHNFPFYIFNFQFYARSGVICSLISYCIHE